MQKSRHALSQRTEIQSENKAGAGAGSIIASAVLTTELTVAKKRRDKKPPGPKYKAWQDLYKAEIGKELRKKGFKADEIEKIAEEFGEALTGLPKLSKMYKFILKGLKRIWDAWDAITKARKTVGEPPPYDE